MPQNPPALLVHNVFFTLKDRSPEAVEHLVAACHKYLKNHPGIVYFAAGTLCPDLNRPVNDRDFQVGLHIVFESREYHDRYQTAAEHLEFIEENKDQWDKVRVFDSLAAPETTRAG